MIWPFSTMTNHAEALNDLNTRLTAAEARIAEWNAVAAISVVPVYEPESLPKGLADGWIEWKGGAEWAGKENDLVEVRLRDNTVQDGEASDFVWVWGEEDILPKWEIVAYRVTQIQA